MLKDFDIRLQYTQKNKQLAIDLGNNEVAMMSGTQDLERILERIADVLIDNFYEQTENQ